MFRSLFFLLIIFFSPPLSYGNNGTEVIPPKDTYISLPWNTTMNEPEKKIEEKYPKTKKITLDTLRVTIDEYYVPQISDLLSKGVDYLEWFNKLDDPYFGKYKLDLRMDTKDERLKLLFKEKF